MKKYIIEITETLKKRVLVLADSKDQAYKKVKEMYQNEEIILDSSHYVSTDFKAAGSQNIEKDSYER